MLGKPSFLVAFGESRHGPGGAGMHVHYEHMADVASWPGITVCRDAHEVVEGVKRVLAEPSVNKELQARASEVAQVGGAQDRILAEIERWMTT